MKNKNNKYIRRSRNTVNAKQLKRRYDRENSISHNNEKFSFQFSKLKVECTQPGTETRKTLALIGLILLVLILVVAVACCFLKINLLPANPFKISSSQIKAWLSNTDGSP